MMVVVSWSLLTLSIALAAIPRYVWAAVGEQLSKQDISMYRQRTVDMFDHAYDGYLEHAYEYDELKPITCCGHDTWGSFSLSLIDALDTLVIMGDYQEFRRVAEVVRTTIHFNQNINVSVFETNIRVVGGLLSAHLFSKKAGVIVGAGWPCEGPLLDMAQDLARRLLPAFETSTGMPYGTVNLMYGVPNQETPITCSAGVGTFLVEFGTLSGLTGDPVFEENAMRAVNAIHRTRSKLDLIGNHINTSSGHWTAIESSIGAGVDSYFEYLVKGAMLLQKPDLLDMFFVYYEAIEKHMKRDDWYFMVHMNNGQVTMAAFQSLEAFWPGLLTLVGDIEEAKASLYNYHQVWKQFGFLPEVYDVPNYAIKRDGYPLRPEFVESVFYLYKATKDPHLLMIAADILESIEFSAKTECGYATVKHVKEHTIEDRMESFYLAETLKYLYLIFAPEDHFMYNDGSKGTVINSNGKQCVIDAGGYVFNTEAHPLDIAAVQCCSKHSNSVADFTDLPIDLFSLLNMVKEDEVSVKRQKKLHNLKERNAFKDAEKTVDIKPDSAKWKTAAVSSREETFQSLDDDLGSKWSIILNPSTPIDVGGSIPVAKTSEATLPLSGSASMAKLVSNTEEMVESREELETKAHSEEDGRVKNTMGFVETGATQFIAKVMSSDSQEQSTLFNGQFGGNVTSRSVNETKESELKISPTVCKFGEKCSMQSFELLSCPALPFFHGLSKFGQIVKRGG